MKPLNILVITTTLNVGGAETAMLNLVRELCKRDDNRHPVKIHFCAVGGRAVFGQQTLLETARSLPCEVELIRARRFYSLSAWLRVIRLIRKHRIDVIHTFLAPADIMGNAMGMLLRIPVVTSLRNVPSHYEDMRADLRWLMRHVAIRRASKLVALSDDIRELSIRHWSLPEHRIVTIENATDLTPFLAVAAPVEHGQAVVVTCIGRLMPQKAHADLFEAARFVLQHRSDVIFRLVGEGELEQSLREKAAELLISDSVEFVGLQRDIPGVLSGTDIFTLSSHWEGMSVAVIEAMAAARASVLTDVGANAELVEDGVHGLIVPAKSPRELADALLRLAEDNELRLRMGVSARQRAINRFSMEHNSRRYTALYHELVA